MSYTPSTPESDANFGDKFVEISVGEKRWVRASVKTYETTGKYIFLKLFKTNENGIFERVQYISLTSSEWEALIDKRFLIHALHFRQNHRRRRRLSQHR